MNSLTPRRLQVGLIFSLLALVVMGPMLKSGFVLTLDMVFTPKLPAPSSLSNVYVFQELLHIINLVLSGQVIEKLLIFAILLLCGLGMYRLIDTQSNWPRYFGGVFYMINPFTYERWMAGQYLVLAGYALLPFLVRSLIGFGQRPDRRAAGRLSLWYTALVLVSIHIFVMTVLLGVIMFLAHLLGQAPKGHYYRDLWRSAAWAIGGFLVLNCYWLIGILTGHSTISQTIDSIGSRDLSAFATATNVHTGLLFNVLSLCGFWLERYKRYAMPNHILAAWIIVFILLASLVLVGARSLKKRQSLPAASLAIGGLIGLVMALGPKAAVSGGLVRAIINHAPLMRGFREPEKFSALIVLAYAYFAAYGLDAILRRLPAKAEARREIIREAAILLPIIYVPTMIFGFANQLKPVQYPASWSSYEAQLKQQPAQGKILFLPWHEYMSYDFSPRIIANPSPAFFSANVIAGTNAQFGGVNDPDPTPTSRFIENQVLAHTNQTDLAVQLTKLRVQYVLLANGYDANQYGWLNRQTGLKQISDRPGLAVYKNEAYGR
jgi:hypothetical protein